MHATIGGRDLRATAVRPSGGSRGVRRSRGRSGRPSSIVLTLSTGFAQSLPARFPWLLLALPVLGALSVGLYRLLRLPAALTTEGVVDELRAGRRVPGSLTVGILGGSCLTLLGGGSVGMEAGALQMGASTGSVLGRAFKLPPARRAATALPTGYRAAIGMAAAFSALFFAPLGSCMFVLELVRFDRAVLRHAPAMLAAALVAYAIARAVGIGDHIPRVALPGLSWAVAAHCLLVGLCCAVGGALFAACLRALRRACAAGQRLVRSRWWPWAALRSRVSCWHAAGRRSRARAWAFCAGRLREAPLRPTSP